MIEKADIPQDTLLEIKRLMKKNTVLVDELPTCDFCSKLAHYDGRTVMGPWAYMCEDHFEQFGIGLGVGRGQKLITASSVCPCCGKTIEPEGMLDVDGIHNICSFCGGDIET